MKVLETEHMKGEVDVGCLAEAVVKTAFRYGSRDNISAIVVRFPEYGLPSAYVLCVGEFASCTLFPCHDDHPYIPCLVVLQGCTSIASRPCGDHDRTKDRGRHGR